MATVALRYASDAEAPMHCATADKAKLEILNSLNWSEAHKEYKWPDFQQHGLDFAEPLCTISLSP